MSLLQDSSIGDLTRGGQLILHFMRMIAQVFRKFGLVMLACTVLLAAAAFMLRTDPHERYLAARYLQAHFEVRVLREPNRSTTLQRADGTVAQTTHGALARSSTLARHTHRLFRLGMSSLAYAALLMSGLFGGLMFWVWRTGSRQREEQHLRGARLVEQGEVRRYLRRRGRASDLTVAGLPLVKGSETLHILLAGSTGTGKSTLLYELLNRIRERGERCICYSRSGDFIQWFYREQYDHILNPFDARCPSWSFWDECPQSYHHDMLAAALIPDNLGKADPFWTIAARIVVAALTQTMARNGERSIPRLMELLSQVSLDVLYDYVRGTEAAAVIDPSSEKTAASIRSTAVAYVRSLRYLPIGRPAFHIRKWVHDEGNQGWIFLNAGAEQISSVRPVLSAWLEVFTSALLSLPPSQTRRAWLVLDELPSLHKIPSLPEFLAEGRKNGGCGAIGFQNVAQVRELYGAEGAQTLTDQCGTWILMRQNNPESAEWAAKALGQVEVLESNQGMSYGANDMRDGISLSQSKKVRPLLLDSQILTLENLEGYIRLPGGLPVAHFQHVWQPVPCPATAFIPTTNPIETNAKSDHGKSNSPPAVARPRKRPSSTATAADAGLFDEVRSPSQPSESP